MEAGFVDDIGEIAIRRTPFELGDESRLRELSGRLCDLTIAPAASISHSAPRPSSETAEQITSLSLDMGKTARYTLLRDALGASDARNG